MYIVVDSNASHASKVDKILIYMYIHINMTLCKYKPRITETNLP